MAKETSLAAHTEEAKYELKSAAHDASKRGEMLPFEKSRDFTTAPY